MDKVVRIKVQRDPAADLHQLDRLLEKARQRADDLDERFLAYLLGLAKLEASNQAQRYRV